MSEPYRVGVSGDIPRQTTGELRFDFDLRLLEETPGAEWDFLPGERGVEIRPEQLAGIDALFLWGTVLTGSSLEGADRLGLVARLGVGYDNVDLAACTQRGVPVTITPDAVRRPMASATLLFVLALAHRLLAKDRITRAGRWEDRWLHPGLGLTGRALGLLGAGNIGRELLRLALPFEMRRIVSDPYLAPELAAAEGFELVDLETLFRESDFLCVLCPLTDETHGLVSGELLASMKPTAHLVSAARGPIVDEDALIEALRGARIAGAAIDVFQQEPVDPANPLLSMDNVIVAPHAIAHTDEFFRLSGASACRNALAIREGCEPTFVVNREVLEHPLFLERLEHNRRAFAASPRPTRAET